VLSCQAAETGKKRILHFALSTLRFFCYTYAYGENDQTQKGETGTKARVFSADENAWRPKTP